MINVVIDIAKADVYEEVAKNTAYLGSRMESETTYRRMFTTAEDETLLERFWQEAKVILSTNLRRVLTEVSERDGVLRLSLSLSASYSEALTESMAGSVRSYFVAAVTAKWLSVMGQADAQTFATEAAALQDDVLRKVFFKRKPVRRSSN